MFLVGCLIFLQLLLSILYVSLDREHLRPVQFRRLRIKSARLLVAVTLATAVAVWSFLAAIDAEKAARATAEHWRTWDERQADAQAALEKLERGLGDAIELSDLIRSAQESTFVAQQQLGRQSDELRGVAETTARRIATASADVKVLHDVMKRRTSAILGHQYSFQSLQAEWTATSALPSNGRQCVSGVIAILPDSTVDWEYPRAAFQNESLDNIVVTPVSGAPVNPYFPSTPEESDDLQEQVQRADRIYFPARTSAFLYLFEYGWPYNPKEYSFDHSLRRAHGPQGDAERLAKAASELFRVELRFYTSLPDSRKDLDVHLARTPSIRMLLWPKDLTTTAHQESPSITAEFNTGVLRVNAMMVLDITGLTSAGSSVCDLKDLWVEWPLMQSGSFNLVITSLTEQQRYFVLDSAQFTVERGGQLWHQMTADDLSRFSDCWE